jgi:hypothetical protein
MQLPLRASRDCKRAEVLKLAREVTGDLTPKSLGSMQERLGEGQRTYHPSLGGESG